MREKHVLHIQMTTFPYLLEKAKSLLSLCAGHSETADILSACAAIILAAALDQGTRDVLSLAALNYAMEHDIQVSDTPHAMTLRETLRKRMLHTPEVLTDGEFQLQSSHYCPNVDLKKRFKTMNNQHLHCNISFIDLKLECLKSHTSLQKTKEMAYEFWKNNFFATDGLHSSL